MSSSRSALSNPLMGPSPTSLTLIVAATHNSFGIGRTSTLPWPALKSEMAYFARVTKRAPPHQINAVIMGRKTWESIPSKFRPLVGRVNVVVTRKKEVIKIGTVKEGGEEQAEHRTGLYNGPGDRRARDSFPHKVGGPYAVGSIEEGVKTLQTLFPSISPSSGAPSTPSPSLSHVFVIGGAEIYAAALKLPNCKRILLTRIYTDFHCDTFFPIQLGGDIEEAQAEDRERELAAEHASGERGGKWVQRSKSELDAWADEDVPRGRREEKGVEWEFEMWERRS